MVAVLSITYMYWTLTLSQLWLVDWNLQRADCFLAPPSVERALTCVLPLLSSEGPITHQHHLLTDGAPKAPWTIKKPRRPRLSTPVMLFAIGAIDSRA